MDTKSYHCANCEKSIPIGDNLFGVFVSKELIESHNSVAAAEEVVCRLYCTACEPEVNLSRVIHPDFQVRKQGWCNCQKCGKEAEAGDTVWAVSNFNGSIDDRGLQIYSSDSLWVVCMPCGKDVDFEQIDVLCRG